MISELDKQNKAIIWYAIIDFYILKKYRIIKKKKEKKSQHNTRAQTYIYIYIGWPPHPKKLNPYIFDWNS